MAFRLRRPPKLEAKHSAFPYQLDALRAVQDLPYAAIFHEQGLGKTKIAVDLILHWIKHDIVDTVFVVTKKMLVQNWMDELEQHSFLSPRTLSGNRRENSIALNSPVMTYVLNYEVISSNLELLTHFQKTCRLAVILDESQKIKSPDSKLSQIFHNFSDGCARRIIMTGTPAANRPYDLWSQIKFLDGGDSLGQSYTDFKERTDLPKELSGIAEYASELSNIMDSISSFTVRETKKSSELKLPDKILLTHKVELETRQRSIYDKYRNELEYEFHGTSGHTVDNADSVLKRLLRLVQCASNPFMIDNTYQNIPAKFDALMHILDEYLDDSTNFIIWTGFISNVQWLSNKLRERGTVMLHGSLSIEERNNSVRVFKEDAACKILIATPGAAKEGLTLTNANHAVFYDRSFSLDDYIQAQDRIHRISQTQDCYVHNLIATDSIDEWVDSLLQAKYMAAQLAQGDIEEMDFNSNFDFDLTSILAEVLESGLDKKEVSRYE